MRFSIGEFSLITSLSIKSLRLYHEKGLLIPAEVDAGSGYRYYDGSNFETAKSIKMLKGTPPWKKTTPSTSRNPNWTRSSSRGTG